MLLEMKQHTPHYITPIKSLCLPLTATPQPTIDSINSLPPLQIALKLTPMHETLVMVDLYCLGEIDEVLWVTNYEFYELWTC